MKNYRYTAICCILTLLALAPAVLTVRHLVLGFNVRDGSSVQLPSFLSFQNIFFNEGWAWLFIYGLIVIGGVRLTSLFFKLESR